MKINILVSITIFLLMSCSGGEKDKAGSVKMQQYMIEGKTLYTQYCSMCHQDEGTGLAQLYPPLNKSDYMQENVDKVACIIKYGRQEPLEVNGTTYTQPMPGYSRLTNLEIAQIMTFIYNSWENDHGMINVKEVDKYMQGCQ